jgi:type VI secretion system protein ImpG
MRSELLSYYERELTYLRKMGADFAGKYPKIAGRLQLESNACDDPHVERLLEGVALLNARVHMKLDDEFPEITQSLLNIVFPHYTRPIPSMTVAEFSVDPQKLKMTSGVFIPRGAVLHSKPIGGAPCRFRNNYDVELWPLRVSGAQWRTPDRLDPPVRAPEAAAAVRIEITCWPDVHFATLGLKKLRFFLNGEGGIIHTLYELLANNCQQILLRDPRPKFRQRMIELPPGSLRPVGFAENESALPYPRRSFAGYRVLQEYFAFPEKFFFFDLHGLDILGAAGFEDRAEIILLLSPYERADRNELLEIGVSEKTFRLGCSPIVNLFPHTCEPIPVDHTKHEYPVIPDVRRPAGMEIFSVDQVACSTRGTNRVTPIEPLFSLRHSIHGESQIFYHLSRRDVQGAADGRTEVFLSLVDLRGNPQEVDADTLVVRCTSTNASLPSRLPFGDETGDFNIDGFSTVHRIVALRKPSPTLHYPIGRGAMWRLVSHLSLNYLSLVEEGRIALQDILRLYQVPSGSYMDQQIEGITNLRSARQFARLVSENGITHVRGVKVEMQLDEDKFVGGGVYLFASIIEHFLAQYVAMNSFSQLKATTRQRKGALREWSPRAGNRFLL